MIGSAEAGGKCGGSGGSQSKTLSCPAGHYIVALSVRRGLYLDRIGIRCAKIDSAGERGALGSFKYAGGTGGSASRSGTCVGDQAVTYIGMFAGRYVDKVTHGVCHARRAQGGFVEDESSIDVFISGPTGGKGCHLSCSFGEALHKLVVRYGSWIDSIEGFCRP
jgi:hypothetical protein